MPDYARNHVFIGYLSPTDYHRVHAPISGRCVHCKLEGADTHSASVKFFGGKFNILNENKRLVVVIESNINVKDETETDETQPMRVALIVVGGIGVDTIVFNPEMEGKVIVRKNGFFWSGKSRF